MNGLPIAFFGLPPDGETGQVLRKKSGTSYDVEWGTGVDKECIIRIFTEAKVINNKKFVIGATYYIGTYEPGDDFSNIGGTNMSGTYFVATGETANVFGDNGSEIELMSPIAIQTSGPIETGAIFRITNDAGDDFSNISLSSSDLFDYQMSLDNWASNGSLSGMYYAFEQPISYVNGNEITIRTKPNFIQKNDTGIEFKVYYDSLLDFIFISASQPIFNDPKLVINISSQSSKSLGDWAIINKKVLVYKRNSEKELYINIRLLP
ncbi:MAG: hypothetical protein WAT79_08335 [Saprospiraceae bacterium]